MSLRSSRIRALRLAPVAAIAVLSLAACQTHAGAAATVAGKTISERTVSSYIKPTMKNLTYQSGQSVSPRTFVLQALLQERVLTDILASKGGNPTDSALTGAKAEALSGSTEAAFTKQITDLGLPVKLEPHLLRIQELAVLLSKKVTTSADQQALVTKFGRRVSVSPRYGAWDPNHLSLTEFGKKQVSPVVTYTGTLPGDLRVAATP